MYVGPIGMMSGLLHVCNCFWVHHMPGKAPVALALDHRVHVPVVRVAMCMPAYKAVAVLAMIHHLGNSQTDHVCHVPA